MLEIFKAPSRSSENFRSQKVQKPPVVYKRKEPTEKPIFAFGKRLDQKSSSLVR